MRSLKILNWVVLIFALSILTGCRQEDEPELTAPDCGESFCMSAYRANKEWVED